MMEVDRSHSLLPGLVRYAAGLAAIVMLSLSAGVLHAQDHSTVTAPDSTATRVMACTACHGEQGQGSGDDYFPRLAGKPAEYLFNQLVDFRDGQRKYPPMNYLLAYMPDAYLQQIADYFSTQRPPARDPEAPRVDAQTLAAKGECC